MCGLPYTHQGLADLLPFLRYSGEVVEAARVDGCDGLRLMFRIIVPIARVGIITAALLVAVFIWNEFFLGFNLSSPMTASVPVYLQKFKEQQGQFVAQLSVLLPLSVSAPRLFAAGSP